MDIVATAPGAPTLFIDATVRHPQQTGQYAQSTSVDGVACQHAESEKLKRYPSVGGLHVVPAALETWGRLGKHLHNLLGDLQAHGALVSQLSATSASRGMQRWYALLGTALVRSIHNAVVTSMERHEGTPATGLNAAPATPSGASHTNHNGSHRAPSTTSVSPAAPRAPESRTPPPLGLSTYFRGLTGTNEMTQLRPQRMGATVQ